MLLALYYIVNRGKRNVVIYAMDKVVADQLKDIVEDYIPSE